jgi:hypothetical protein
MMYDIDPDFPEYSARDEKTDEAKAALMTELFDREPKRVVYERQATVLFERRFFHWITARALKELASVDTPNRPVVDT